MARLSELGIDFEHWCFACGRLNEAGLHLDIEVSTDRAEAIFTPQRRHEGYDGTVHGGIVSALLDETMGWAIFHQGIWGVTARLSVAFRKPVRVGDELRVVGEVAKRRSRAIETRGTVARARDGEVLAEADATFLIMPAERRQELERRYAGTGEAFARLREAVEREHVAQNGKKEHLRT